MRFIRPIIIKCNECHELIEVETDLESVSSTERNMGVELEYESIFEEYCPKCQSPLYLKLSVWEYPEGAVNFSDEVIKGAILIEGPVYNPHNYD